MPIRVSVVSTGGVFKGNCNTIDGIHNDSFRLEKIKIVTCEAQIGGPIMCYHFEIVPDRDFRKNAKFERCKVFLFLDFAVEAYNPRTWFESLTASSLIIFNRRVLTGCYLDWCAWRGPLIGFLFTIALRKDSDEFVNKNKNRLCR